MTEVNHSARSPTTDRPSFLPARSINSGPRAESALCIEHERQTERGAQVAIGDRY